MRLPLLLVSILVLASGFASGCDADPYGQVAVPLVPDETVHIVAVLEHSPDTTFHHAQVYIGRVTDPLDRSYDLLADAERKPSDELWHPILWAQVGMRLYTLHLQPTPDDDASVSVTGPLDRPDEQTVTFQHERRGAYGDLARHLNPQPGERYRLDVQLSDGRRYTAETKIPRAATFDLPEDTIRVPVSLQPQAVGAVSRTEVGWVEIPITVDPETVLTSSSENCSLACDHYYWGIDTSIGEGIPYEDRNDYLRQGGAYLTQTNAFVGQPTVRAGWIDVSDRAPRYERDLYLRVYSFGPDLSRYYAPEDNQFYASPPGDPWAEREYKTWRVVAERETDFLPDASNILRVGPDGRPLPKAESDAVGVFGGYSARYLHRIRVPVRDFDPAEAGWPSVDP